MDYMYLDLHVFKGGAYYQSIFAWFMTTCMWEKQISHVQVARAIEVQKENWRQPHVF